jgi:hypothetical protein
MKAPAQGTATLAATLWVGGLWAIGYVAVPVLFKSQPDKQLAGMLAGKMFSLVAYIGMASACYLLGYQIAQWGKSAIRQALSWVIAIMLLLDLIGQFGLQPLMAELKVQALPDEVTHSAFAGRFKMLHGIASILYLAQSILGAVLVLKMRRC